MTSDKEVYLVDEKVDRQKQIESLELGDSIALVKRVDLSFGVNPDNLITFRKKLRGVMDVQCHRARRRLPDAEFKVENGSFITSDASMMIVVTITRMN